MLPETAVVYLRVSTARQEASGLGLEAQREAVAHFLRNGQCRILGEFIEAQSGTKSTRPQLGNAVRLARLHRASLIVAKLDRLTRSASFLLDLLDSGLDVRFCDLPQVEGPQGRFLLQSMAAVAELEAGLISIRTKAALAAAKAHGRCLGGNRGYVATDTARCAAKAARGRLAHDRASQVMPAIFNAKRNGAISLRQIAVHLNEQRIPTARGGGSWSAMQIKRIIDRMDERNKST